MLSKLIYKYIEFQINYIDEKIKLPDIIKEEIKKNWDDLYKTGKRFTNGELFTVEMMEVKKEFLNFIAKKTSYDHYL